MSSTIEELYYGNIPLSERDFKRNSEYAQVLTLVARNEEKLVETLTEAQKETFGKFKDNTSELNSATEVTAFTLGFKLGLRLTAEAFINGTDVQNLITVKQSSCGKASHIALPIITVILQFPIAVVRIQN